MCEFNFETESLNCGECAVVCESCGELICEEERVEISYYSYCTDCADDIRHTRGNPGLTDYLIEAGVEEENWEL